MFMLVLAGIFLVLASFLSLANIVGCVNATNEQGYSFVPIPSLLFSFFAYMTARDTLGYWAFLPTIIDPGTWVLTILMFGICHKLLFRWK